MTLWAAGRRLMRDRLWAAGLVLLAGAIPIIGYHLAPIALSSEVGIALAGAWLLPMIAAMVAEWAYYERLLAATGALDARRGPAQRFAGFAVRWLALVAVVVLGPFLALFGWIFAGLVSEPLILLLDLSIEALILMTYALVGPIFPRHLAGQPTRLRELIRGDGFRRRARRLWPIFLVTAVSSVIIPRGGVVSFYEDLARGALSDLIYLYGTAMLVVLVADDFAQEDTAPIEAMRRVFD